MDANTNTNTNMKVMSYREYEDSPIWLEANGKRSEVIRDAITLYYQSSTQELSLKNNNQNVKEGND